MLKFIFVSYLALTVCFGCEGQSKKSESQIVGNAVKGKVGDNELQEYRSSCLDELFRAIAKANTKNYPADSFFYSVGVSRNAKTIRLEIVPEQWNASEKIDYKGILTQDGISFLLRGDFEKDTLFSKGHSQYKVQLKKSLLNTDDEAFTQEPVLQGFFLNCSSLPIYMEVYTANKISGFVMKAQGSSMIIQKN